MIEITVKIDIDRFKAKREFTTISEAIDWLKYCKRIYPKLIGKVKK